MRWLYPFMAAIALAPFAALQPAHAQADPTMHMVTYIEVVPAAKNQAAALLRQLADASRKDAGLLRFETLQRNAVPSQFLVLKTWKDQQALDTHADAAHARQARERLQPLLLAPIDDRLSVAITASPLPAAGGRGAIFVATHVDVSQANREKGTGLLRPFADIARKDAGNMRFDVLQKQRTNHFTVVEIWKDQRSNTAHDLAAHTRGFRGEIDPLLGALYDQRWYKAL